ncbi:hypothetical protein FKG96_10105 [Olivibacter sp. LS-1]|uniref:hypothetical protein n=1 Tax=Olivibacter sp. LS-1 TaxID=2592345 RepID=UPI0011EB3F3F|nr:hypothetical protein [Olivibacter sp. LS-1]QEL01146.1 hypothetical protein FKG96_10105 [Olivibacter sp. LS-1]
MKNILIFVLIAIIACMAWIQLRNGDRKPDVSNSKSPVDLEAQELSRKVDSAGLEHVIYKEAEPITKLIEVKVEDKAKVDSLMKVVGIKESQLKSVTNAYGQVVAENIQLRKRPTDTAYIMSDKWLTLSFTPKNDTLAISNFSYNFDFQSVSYDPRKWYEKIYNWNDVTYTNIWSTDKRAKIRGYEKLTIAEKEPDLGYSIKASAMYLPNIDETGFGGKINIRFKRINASGSYLYSPNMNQWYPAFGIDIDLIGKH